MSHKCAMCGYVEPTGNKEISNVMNIYVNKKNPANEIGLNSAEKEVVFDKGTEKERMFVRKDVYLKSLENKGVMQTGKAEPTKTTSPILVQKPVTTSPTIPTGATEPVVQTDKK